MGMRLEELTEGELSLVRAAVDLIADEHGWVRSELLDAAEAKLDKAIDALKELIFLSDEGDIVDWLNALSSAQELMAEIKGE
jgi:hypothetical protein